MTKLSVNLNKVCLLRNSRGIDQPSLAWASETCIAAGAHGLTLHPRPDGRHALWSDVAHLKETSPVELNIEGNPTPDFVENVLRYEPTQCTLVPDAPDQLTSDHGWMLRYRGEPTDDARRLADLVPGLRAAGIRVSLFMDPDLDQLDAAQELGVDRIELYTEPYARAFGTERETSVWELYEGTAREATRIGLGVNAGHDLNLDNLARFLTIPGILEVSIGHALVADALRMGLDRATVRYLGLVARAGG
ncbi:MAG: pyridoxine 5'-phosphate synthase [Planctomycetota bacterium]